MPFNPGPFSLPGREPAASGAALTEPKPAVAVSEGFTGKTVIVTGGATGLGRAVCLEFARLGCNVAFCFVGMPGRDVRETALLTETTLSAMGVGVYADTCDVRDRAAVDAFVAKVQEKFGGVHYLINNAGIAMDGALWRLSTEDWAKVLDTNLTGAFHCISAVSPIFRGQRYGKVVSISSHQSVRPGFGVASYAASKAGLEGLTRAAAMDLGPANVNVNAVAPGFVRTERLEQLPSEVIERAKKHAVLGRIAEPSDVAAVVAFLCSGVARHITGQVLVVDGGLSLG
ncbi:MAG: SDR family oxidoreductase [Gemmatimonadota bacterium]|jgi:3-oxoacyl-[acyl-carrier protein] reductase|nr:SDR family oxidoreductase [Gemmatimonadota bacterium]